MSRRTAPTDAPGPGRRRAALGLLVLLLASGAALAADRENCLLCHRFRGLSRLDPNTGELRLFFTSEEYYAYRQGQHARVDCTGCHVREEVETIPHNVKTAVDCTQTCHVSPATGTELRFSHQGVQDSLNRSVHAPERLADLGFDPPLLRPGQSECLYCHDQPTFGTGTRIPEEFISHSGGTRCDTCHIEALPIEIDYFANHVAARMKPARTVRQLAQVCAVCHSNDRIIEQTGTHDAVASYLHSFHGKASLLGSDETATCVHCHSSPEGDQHLMLAQLDPQSPIHVEQVAETCRTPACHAGAPPEVSRAAVHLHLDPAQRTPEWFVAAAFIVMTATVMAVFFLLVILELINAVVRRADPQHHAYVRLARLVQSHPRGRERLRRMTVHQRFQHWILAISFILLVFTGMPIKFAEAEWAHWAVTAFGGLTSARWIHRVAGVILIGIFLYHITYLLTLGVQRIQSDRRAGIRKSLFQRIMAFPMMITPRDILQFGQLMAYLVGLRKHRPQFGHYNFGEKFEYWAVFWGVPVMGLSGIALWGMPVVTEWLPGRAMNFAFIIHSDEAFLAFIYIASIHLFSVIFAPTVFPLSLGTLTGQAPAQEVAERHRHELADLAKDLDVGVPREHELGRTRWRAWARSIGLRLYSVAIAGGYAFIAFISLRYLLLMLLTRQTAPVEIRNIPTRLDAQEFFASAVAPGDHEPHAHERPRGPLAHFHQVPQWFTPDPQNSCTTAGCHMPLPHGQRVEVRAFLNMHATFVDCGVCHAHETGTTADAHWISVTDRTVAPVPAILRLEARLDALDEVPDAEAPAVATDLKVLLREALPASNYHEQLQNWLLRLETTYPASRTWHGIIADMQAGIHMHVHGEYAAKIALFHGDALVGRPTEAQREATEIYVDRGAQLPADQQQELLDRVHADIKPMGAMCTPCHHPDSELLDIAELGYPPERVQALRNSAIVRSVLSIEQGQPFVLPLDQDGERE